jgi:hypothetical protein
VIFYNYQIIFLLKKMWNMSMVRWIESMVTAHRGPPVSLNRGHRRLDEWLRFKREGVSS